MDSLLLCVISVVDGELIRIEEEEIDFALPGCQIFGGGAAGGQVTKIEFEEIHVILSRQLFQFLNRRFALFLVA